MIIQRATDWLATSRRDIRQLSRKQVALLVVLIAALSYAGAVVPGKLMVVDSPSVGHRLFYYKPHFDPATLTKGTYVVFDLYTRMRPGCWPCQVVKQIGCAAGDLLEVEKRHFYCNGRYLGTAKTTALDGRPLRAFNYNGVVPEGKLFVIGACVDSYDSRYIGFVDKDHVKAVADPLL